MHTARKLSIVCSIILSQVGPVMTPLCGVMTTLGQPQSGSSRGRGSGSVTSKAAPQMVRCWRASTNASWSTNPPVQKMMYRMYLLWLLMGSCNTVRKV